MGSQSVTRGVPHRFIPSPILFNILTNYLDEEIESTLTIFADDSKPGDKVDRHVLHRDTGSLEEWSSKNIVKINKGKVLHLVQNNQRVQCQPGSVWLGSSLAKSDWGVLVDSNLNMSQQCTSAATWANRVRSCIRRGITSRDRNMITPLWSVLVRPHLEYSVQFGSPQPKTDTD